MGDAGTGTGVITAVEAVIRGGAKAVDAATAGGIAMNVAAAGVWL